VRTATAPSVTVVVPTHGRPELVRRALASIAASDYDGPLDVVVVADREEPDPTLADADGRRPVRVVANGRTEGLAGARNTGILAASGDLVAFCDDDAEWRPDTLGRQVAVLADPAVGVVTTGIAVHARGKVHERVLERDRVTTAELTRSRVAEAHPSSFLVRRSLLLGPIGLVDEDLPGSYAEDYEWLLRASRVTEVAAVPAPLVDVHWHEGSYFAERWRTIVAALDHLLEVSPELAADGRGRARIEAQQAFAHAALGERGDARRLALRALGRAPNQRRAWLALAVSSGVVPADTVVRLAAARGRGI
jgi:glycosyltransferase involved in cell wall biosynthesis